MEDDSSLNSQQCHNAGCWLKASQSALVINAGLSMVNTDIRTDVNLTRRNYENFKDKLPFMVTKASTDASFTNTTDVLQMEILV